MKGIDFVEEEYNSELHHYDEKLKGVDFIYTY